MAKATQDQLDRIAQLELENEALRAQANRTFSSVEDEMRKIDRKGRDTSGSILYHEVTDHRNITLWTKDGQRIGPLHPANAKRALLEFRGLGIELSATQPTGEEVEAYQLTDEYKNKVKAENARRALKNKSRKTGQMDKLIATMEKVYGLDKSQINNILSPEQVRGR